MITRPHLLAIRHDCEDDRKAFVHFWAVMGHMLGVEDRYNMCLLPFDSVVVVCQAMIRYIFLPLIQLETPLFRRMVEALFNGLSQIVPNMTYDIQMFTTKRVLGVPGYQYKVDLSKENICRQLFTQQEAEDLREQIFRHTGVEYREFTFSTSIPIVIMHRRKDNRKIVLDANANELPKRYPTSINPFPEQDDEYDREITFADPEKEGWQSYLNDSQFHSLSRHDQMVIKARIYMMRLGEFRVFRYLFETVLSLVLYFMRKQFKSKPLLNVLKSG